MRNTNAEHKSHPTEANPSPFTDPLLNSLLNSTRSVLQAITQPFSNPSDSKEHHLEDLAESSSIDYLLNDLHSNYTNQQTGTKALFLALIQEFEHPADVIKQFMQFLDDPNIAQVNDPGVQIDDEENTFWHYLATHLQDPTAQTALTKLTSQYSNSQRYTNSLGDTYLHTILYTINDLSIPFARHADYHALWVKDHFGRTPLQLALLTGQEKAAKQLLSRHAEFTYPFDASLRHNYISVFIAPDAIPINRDRLQAYYPTGLWQHMIELARKHNKKTSGHRQQVEAAWDTLFHPDTVRAMSMLPEYEEQNGDKVALMAKQAQYLILCTTNIEQLRFVQGGTLFHYLMSQPIDYSIAITTLFSSIKYAASEDADQHVLSFLMQDNDQGHHALEHFLVQQTGNMNHITNLYFNLRLFSISDRFFADNKTILHALANFPDTHPNVQHVARSLLATPQPTAQNEYGIVRYLPKCITRCAQPVNRRNPPPNSTKWMRDRWNSEKTQWTKFKDYLKLKDTSLMPIQVACNQHMPSVSWINLFLDFRSPSNATVNREPLLHHLVQRQEDNLEIDHLIERLLKQKKSSCFTHFRRPANSVYSTQGENLLQSLFAVDMPSFIRHRRAVMLVHYGASLRCSLDDMGNTLLHLMVEATMQQRLDIAILTYLITYDPRALSTQNNLNRDVFKDFKLKYFKGRIASNPLAQKIGNMLKKIEKDGFSPHSLWVTESAGVVVTLSLFTSLMLSISLSAELHAKQFEGVNTNFLYALAINFALVELPLIYRHLKTDYARICRDTGYHSARWESIKRAAKRYGRFLVGSLALHPIFGIWYQEKDRHFFSLFLLRQFNSFFHFITHGAAIAAVFREFEDDWAAHWSVLAGLAISLSCTYITAEDYFKAKGDHRDLTPYTFRVLTYEDICAGDYFPAQPVLDPPNHIERKQQDQPPIVHAQHAHSASSHLDTAAAILAGSAQAAQSLMISSLVNQLLASENFLEDGHFSWHDSTDLFVLGLYILTAISSAHYSQGFIRTKISHSLHFLRQLPARISSTLHPQADEPSANSLNLLSLLLGSGFMVYPVVEIGIGLAELQHHETVEFLEWLDVFGHNASQCAWWITGLSTVAYSLSFFAESMEQSYLHADRYLRQPCINLQKSGTRSLSRLVDYTLNLFNPTRRLERIPTASQIGLLPQLSSNT